MSEFDRPLLGYRLVDILRGDTLQRIALRELGDASRWHDLANINNLLPPYITDDPAQASDRVLLSGSVLAAPAITSASESVTKRTEADLYLSDVELVDGLVQDNGEGDILICSGRTNLRQALIHRVIVERRELMFHPEYGCLVRTLIGSVNGPTASTLAAQYVAATLRADPRIRRVQSVTATVRGDAIDVIAAVQPTVGETTKIQATL